MRLSLRAGEKIYINGAVLRADRKVSLELLNDATFLLEAHVMQPDTATTPMRRLYFAVQTMLMAPQDSGRARALFELEATSLAGAGDQRVQEARNLVDRGRHYEALKAIRVALKQDEARAA